MTLVLHVDHNSTSIVEGRIQGEAYKGLKRALGYLPENYQWMKRQFAQQYGKAAAANYDGYVSSVCYNRANCRCHIKKDYTHFPSGVLHLARKFFDTHGIPYRLVDVRQHATRRELDLKLIDSFPFYDYQLKIAEDACNRQRGILQMATGSGKTATSAKIIADLGLSSFVFFVPSVDLLEQAREELQKLIRLNGKAVEVGAVGGGYKDIKPITISTVQTAVRCLGGKYIKYDNEDTDKDETDISDIKNEFREYLRGVKGLVGDECHHWSSETCQIISDACESAHYKYGLSATPFRDKGDDILIEACFGGVIGKINASDLIARNILVKPDIFFVHVDSQSSYNTYANVYKDCIVNNDTRNAYISKLATKFYDSGRYPLILVKEIQHGKKLESIIPNSKFIHGSTSGKNRKEYIERMRDERVGVTIASSLPYEELLFVKIDGIIQQIEIGKLCHDYATHVSLGRVETACSLNGINLAWQKVTHTHIHENTHDLVRVRTNKGEETIVTSNHSLVDSDLNMVKPLAGNAACAPQGFPDYTWNSKNGYLNLLEMLEPYNDGSLEVEVLNIDQPGIRKLSSHWKYIQDPKSVSKSTRWRVAAELKK
ncbi:MAG: DEAD/DEAH box helicase family protein [Candidatus Competibacteraceae bacterium]|nr:DEAD/DEAH box helicase family protein [Candidatus Competibacteraceae bacterium]